MRTMVCQGVSRYSLLAEHRTMRMSGLILPVMPKTFRECFPEEAILDAASTSFFFFRGLLMTDFALRVASSNVIDLFFKLFSPRLEQFAALFCTQ